MQTLLASILLLIVAITSPAMCRPVSLCIASLTNDECQCEDDGTCEGCEQSTDSLVCCLHFDALPDGEPPAPAAHTPVAMIYLLAEMDPVAEAVNLPRNATLPREATLRAPPPGTRRQAVLEIWNL